MRRMAAVVSGLFLVVAAGCATTSISWQEQLKSYPVINLGDPKPAGEEYVVHIPKGKPFPTTVFIEGGFLDKDVAQEVYMAPKKDVYLYKNWMSFDMERWQRTRATLAMDWDVGIPSWENPQPGHLKIKINEREQ